MTELTPPRIGRVLLRLLRLRARRTDIEGDLMELFQLRAASRGARYARRRYVGDVLSLWLRHPHEGLLECHTTPQRSRLMRVREVLQDLTYAARLMRRSPAVVSITIAGLAVAIGVSTSIFSILSIVAFRSSGIRDSSALIRVMKAYRDGMGNAWSYADYLQLRDHTRTVGLEASLRDAASFSTRPDADDTREAGVLLVSGGYLAMMKPRASLGRILTPADDQPGSQPVVVVNHAWWSSALGADPSIVGRSLWLNGRRFVVVGVAERGFSGTDDTPPAIWMSLANYHVLNGGPPLDRRSSTSVEIAASLAPGVSMEQAEAELAAIVRRGDLGRIEAVEPAGSDGPRGRDGEHARAVQETLTGVRVLPFVSGPGKNAWQIALIVTVVLTAIGLVLLLACANVTNLLLASGAARRSEIGVRIAVGAGRARIVRQLLTESLALGLAAGAVSLLVAVWLLPILADVVDVPPTFDVAFDGRTYAFLWGISMLAGLGAGLVPAKDALRDVRYASNGTPAPAGSRSSRRTRKRRSVLVAVQAAASMVLLVVAGLLARAAVHAADLDIGFDPSGLITISPAFERGTSHAAANRYWEQALARVRALPGVQAVTLGEVPPFSGGSRVTTFRRAGARYTIQHNATLAEYFRTLGLRVLAGRTYTAADVAARAPVVVISEALARDFYQGTSPIGHSLERILPGSHATIIGVVSNAITARLRDTGAAAVYEPMHDTRSARMVVRCSGPPEALMLLLRSTLHSIDSRLRVSMATVSDGLERQLEEPRALSTLAGLLAAVALALALVGLYGVTAFVTEQRRQEIGVRVALGATRGDVMRLLVRDGLRPVLFGLTAGLVGAALGSRILAGVLYGISPADPLTFAGALIVLLAGAAVAIVVPTRRAAAADPAVVLRES